MVKGKLEEAYSKARFTEGEYYVQYRDFKELIQLPLKQFELIAEIVPTHRIARILQWTTIGLTDGKDKWESGGFVRLYESSDSNLLSLPVVMHDTVDEETLRFVEMRDALKEKTVWQRYVELEPIKRLEEEGRELIGHALYITEKRDGENTSLWLDENGEPRISSHNMVNPSGDIITRFKATKEYEKAVEFLKTEKETYNRDFILYGELIKVGVSPTRIEPKHKKGTWVLFDIFLVKDKVYLSYNEVYQLAYHYKIPVVKAIGIFIPKSIEELFDKVKEWKTWAKKHRREGVVIKSYSNQTFAKEKIDLPDLPPIPRKLQEELLLPPMPPETIQRALLHAIDAVGKDKWNDKRLAMPMLAKAISIEGKEHSYKPPRDIYKIYLDNLSKP